MESVGSHFESAGDSALCQSCGACCAHDASWPRFSLESDQEIAAIPEVLVAANGSGMRSEGDRCAALTGEIGRHAACTIYMARPLVCRDCQPGDLECNIARARYGFTLLPLRPSGDTQYVDESIASIPPHD